MKLGGVGKFREALSSSDLHWPDSEILEAKTSPLRVCDLRVRGAQAKFGRAHEPRWESDSQKSMHQGF